MPLPFSFAGDCDSEASAGFAVIFLDSWFVAVGAAGGGVGEPFWVLAVIIYKYKAVYSILPAAEEQVGGERGEWPCERGEVNCRIACASCRSMRCPRLLVFFFSPSCSLQVADVYLTAESNYSPFSFPSFISYLSFPRYIYILFLPLFSLDLSRRNTIILTATHAELRHQVKISSGYVRPLTG